MNHEHVGPIDKACSRCIGEANEMTRQKERRRTIWGVALLVAIALAFAGFMSWFLSSHGSQIR
jgi:cobalamin biosynthesis protein CobD/CbiB